MAEETEETKALVKNCLLVEISESPTSCTHRPASILCCPWDSVWNSIHLPGSCPDRRVYLHLNSLVCTRFLDRASVYIQGSLHVPCLPYAVSTEASLKSFWQQSLATEQFKTSQERRKGRRRSQESRKQAMLLKNQIKTSGKVLERWESV